MKRAERARLSGTARSARRSEHLPFRSARGSGRRIEEAGLGARTGSRRSDSREQSGERIPYMAGRPVTPHRAVIVYDWFVSCCIALQSQFIRLQYTNCTTMIRYVVTYGLITSYRKSSHAVRSGRASPCRAPGASGRPERRRIITCLPLSGSRTRPRDPWSLPKIGRHGQSHHDLWSTPSDFVDPERRYDFRRTLVSPWRGTGYPRGARQREAVGTARSDRGVRHDTGFRSTYA